MEGTFFVRSIQVSVASVWRPYCQYDRYPGAGGGAEYSEELKEKQCAQGLPSHQAVQARYPLISDGKACRNDCGSCGERVEVRVRTECS